MNLWTFLTVLFCCAVTLVKTDLVSEEHKLHDYLLNETRYNKFQRPVLNSSEKVTIKFGIALIQLYELDERTEQISAHIWIRKLWRDAYLVWNSDDFGGVTTLRVPSDAVWQPDLTLYNGVGELKPHDTLAVVYNPGDVLHIPAATVVAMCPMDLTKFPFDEQTCVFKFGSWAYDGFQIDLDLYEGQENIDLSDHVGNKAWEVVDTSAKVTRKYYPCCKEPYPDVRFNLTLRRRITYYHYVFVTPAVMLALLCPVLFVLPSDDTGKFTFGGTLLVTMAILYMMLEEQLPRSHNNVPVIGVYYSVVFVLTSLSVAVSAVTTNMANRATRFSHPPAFLKTIVLSCLGRVVCVSYDSTYGVGTSNVALQEASGDKQEGSQVTQITEWRLMARVLDRIFFILFLIVVILTTLVLLA